MATARAAGITKRVGIGTRRDVDATTALGWNRKAAARTSRGLAGAIETGGDKQAARLQHDQSALNTAITELHDMNSRKEAKCELIEEADEELFQKRRAEEEGLAQVVMQRQDYSQQTADAESESGLAVSSL